MQELELAKKVLDDIIDGGTPFNEALRKVFQPDESIRPLRPLVAALVGCELRHHLLFRELLSHYEGLSEEEKRYLSLGLADIFFVRRIAKEEMVNALSEAIGLEKLSAFEALFAQSEVPGVLMPENLSKSGNKYLSLRYNAPEWVLKIWSHYGFGTMYKILKKNNRPGPQTVRVRLSKTSADAVIGNSVDFSKAPVEGMLFYNGKTPLRKLEEFRRGNLFLERMLTKELLDKYRIHEPFELFCYDGNEDGSVLKEIIETYGKEIGLNLGVPSLDSHADVTAMLRRDGLKNVNFFAAKPDCLESAISKPQDLVIACPNSTKFELVREEPDFLLHFKKDEMDALFEQEKAVLDGCAKYVAEDGTLIYMIYTISKKEGHQTIASFLSNNPEFKIVEERQAFPFEETDTAMYYAVMKKGKKEEAEAANAATSEMPAKEGE